MIKGAVKDRKLTHGQYTPEEFGRMTIWQLRNLFGFQGLPPEFSYQQAFWRARRLRGESEFEIWKVWNDEVVAMLNKNKGNGSGNAQPGVT